MKFCQPHWDALRAAIDTRGMGHLVAANGRDAFARMKSELEGTSERDDFDPLMAAHWMIDTRATEVVGLSLYFGEAVCPVCELLKVTPPPPEGHRYKTNEEYFIDGPADAMLATAHELKMMDTSVSGGRDAE